MTQPTILLLCSVEGGSAVAIRHAQRIQRGAERRYPELSFDRVLGRTPDDDPTTGDGPSIERLVEYAVRRISGQGGLLDREPVGAVWVVSAISSDLKPQIAAAHAAGLPVSILDALEVEQLFSLGELPPPADLFAEPERPDFRSPEAVVSAYFAGAEAVLGMQALPLARLCRSGGNAHGRKAQLECAGLRIALATGIMHRAQASPRWCPEMLVILWVAYIERGPMVSAARAARLGLGDVARRRASRLRARALDIIRAELDALSCAVLEETS